MNNTVKELLIDLVEYHRTIEATDTDHKRLQHLARRATQALDVEQARHNLHARAVDPFAVEEAGVCSPQLNLNFKNENEW
mgnify:CR=1 FL=1